MEPRVGALKDLLNAHVPASAKEARSLARMRRFISWLARPFDEHADPMHFTASAIVIDGAGRTLLHRHRRLGLWLQPGGHIDAGECPHDAARRETLEETGLDARHLSAEPLLLHVDVHPGGRGHVHLDLRYLLQVGEGSEPSPPPGESQDVAWFSYAAAAERSDLSVAEALARLTSGSARASR